MSLQSAKARRFLYEAPVGVPYSPELQELISLREDELQSTIIEPLLRHLGFTHVCDYSGPTETGKDLVALKKDDLGQQRFYGIQVKRYKASARAGSDSSFGRLLDQLRQLMEEPALDPQTHIERPIDAGIFITPYPIPLHVIQRFRERTQDPLFKTLTFLDGPVLLDLIRAKATLLLSRFSLPTQYRLRIDGVVSRIPESAAAFGLSAPLELDSVYVDASLGHGIRALYAVAEAAPVGRILASPSNAEKFGDSLRKEFPSLALPVLKRAKQLETRLERALTAERARADRERNRLDEAYARELRYFRSAKNQRRQIDDAPPLRPTRPVDALVAVDRALTEAETRLRSRHQVGVDCDPFLLPVRRAARKFLDDLRTLTERDSCSHCTAVVHAGVVAQRRSALLLRTPLLSHLLPPVSRTSAVMPGSQSIPSSLLTKLRTHVFVLGAPGSGKSTLLRRLTQHAARHSDAGVPVFLPLVGLPPTEDGVLSGCARVLTNCGYSRSEANAHRLVRSLIRKGTLRLFLDGIDETGDGATRMLGAIRTLASRFGKCPIVASTRDTFRLPEWDDAFVVRLEPFSIAQLQEFVRRWFAAQPSTAAGLMAWLADTPSMAATAGTPLIAALLCSLFESGADMPKTEVELYSGRLDLLLGKWERAKGILPLPADVRDWYRLFLRALAIRIHSATQRESSQQEALTVAAQYQNARVHRSAGALVEDCVRRGILFREDSGSVSFGHLTYQEHLVAEWLCDNHPIPFIWSRLHEPWWAKAIEFYASIRINIGPLLKEALRYRGEAHSMERLVSLCRLAPLTAPELVTKIKRQPRSVEIPEYKWTAPPPPLDFS